MMVLTKGQNGPLSADEVSISFSVPASADLSALLVTDAGNVRSDNDFVFFNQPSAPGVVLRGDSLNISLKQVPTDIAQIRAVITLGLGTFAGMAPAVRVAGPDSTVLYDYQITGLDTESIVIALELYRRQDVWKVRAVGQGYAGGFAALVSDHGVSVDEEPAEPPTDGVRTVAGEASLSLEKRQQLDMRKREVVNVLKGKGVSLEKGLRARVILVIDKTLSMTGLYKNKTVHRVVERMVPVATQLDDDGNLEAYLYAVSYLRMPDITVAQAESWSEQYLHLKGTHNGIDFGRLGGHKSPL